MASAAAGESATELLRKNGFEEAKAQKYLWSKRNDWERGKIDEVDFSFLFTAGIDLAGLQGTQVRADFQCSR